MRTIFTCLFGLLPSSKIKIRLLNLIGHQIEKSSLLGINFFWKVERIDLGKNTRISNLNFFRNLKKIVLNDFATISNLNWITGSSELASQGAPCCLTMESKSVITSRHYIDTTGGVYFGLGSAITGVRSTLMTHGVDYKTNLQSWKSIQIGERTLVGSNALIVPGSVVPSHSIFGMGSLISSDKSNHYKLYVNPVAQSKKDIPPNSLYFLR